METNKISKIYNLIILDESGSMGGIRQQALGGANETIQMIRSEYEANPELEQYITFVTFDSNSKRETVRTLIDCRRADEVADLREADYSPLGGTPLFDAIGISVNNLKAKVGKDEKALVTIITDGHENSSKEYDGNDVKTLIEELKNQGWTFTYIGANQDSIEVALTMSITSALNFKADAVSHAAMWGKLNSYRRDYYRRARRGEDGLEEDFFQCKEPGRVTPQRIDRLREGQIFVFGSNLQGNHLGGAARAAAERFGAVWGQGVGLQGRSYAIPTMQGGVETIRPYVDEFIAFADAHPELTFLVTPIGCGIAGFTPGEIAPLFISAMGLRNVWLPESFWKILREL